MALLLSRHVLQFLDFRDIQLIRGVCWSWNSVCSSRKTEKECIRSYGIPRRYRFKCWLAFSQAQGISEVAGGVSTYRSSLAKSKFRTLNHEATWFKLTQQPGLEGEIARDVTRTFPTRVLFRVKNGLGQRMLFNILIALAVYEPKVGYCQGMNFVVAVMLLVALGFEIPSDNPDELALATNGMPADIQEEVESKVFWLMVAFLNRFDMRELWRPGVPQLKLRIYQFEKLISTKLPAVYAHFKSIGLAPDFFASQWFLTLMSYNVSLEQLVKVWDVLIFDGWKTIFRVGIAVLSRCEDEILLMDLEQLSNFFRHGKSQCSDQGVGAKWYLSDQGGLGNLFNVKISTRELADLESDYITHILLSRIREAPLQGPGNEEVSTLDETRFGDDDIFVDHRLAAVFKEEIDHLDQDTKSDVQYLRDKIEQAEKRYNLVEEEFRVVAEEYMEIKTSLDELKASKKAVSEQLYQLTQGATGLEKDYVLFLDKIEFIDSRIRAVTDQFRDALWRTSQTQVDLEEIVERKNAFSQQLHAVLETNENLKSNAIKQIWNKLQ